MVEKKVIDNIIEYEQGNLKNQQVLELYSTLIKSGLCYKLQGHYGRTAEALISEGYIDGEGNLLTGKD